MLNLYNCDKVCTDCIKKYKIKHLPEFQHKQERPSFNISCDGIPKEFVSEGVLAHFADIDYKEALALLDPVVWAEENLDWYCLDPTGEIWKKKNPLEYYKWKEKHPNDDIHGKSRYHRPYQAEMLRCSAKRKVFRIGRQAGKTETIVVSMLYHLVTRPGLPDDEGFQIVLLAPYQSQIDLVFKRLRQLIWNSPKLKASIYRTVKAPQYCIELNNGSSVIGFTAGTKSGSGAASARGQHAHMLVFDEADYLSPDDMDAAMSIVTNYPECKIWMSSTPSGKRDKFYGVCNDNDWREFYYPSYINPMWNEELERTFKRTLTSLGWIHEIEANFGEMEQGVFQHAYVAAAQASYKYGDLTPDLNWIYSIGVDWNDTKNGTTIVVVGLDKIRNRYCVVDSQIVRREGWTQTKACTEIIRLNRFWNPSIIYIDEGHGGTQLEFLRKVGFEALQDKSRGYTHPDARLTKIIAYDFGSKIETRDPFTKQPMQKWAKGFLVENAVRFFENNVIYYPGTDDVLTKQLEGYCIDRVSDIGRCVYKPGPAGDHSLDAMMLSLVGFALEMSSIGKPRYRMDIVFAPPLGLGDTKENVVTEVAPNIFTVQPPPQTSGNIPSKPEMNRSIENVQKGPGLPGRTRTSQLPLWAHEGFLRDGPPVMNSNSTQNGVLYRITRPDKPKRRNI
jgi:hypothetical protein